MMRVSFRATAQNAAEPVTVAEMRAQARIDDGADDALLLGYMIAAREHAEAFLGRPILPTPMLAEIEEWPMDRLVIDAPVISVDAVTYTGPGDVLLAWNDYVLRSAPGGVKTLRPATGASWPTLGDDPVIAINITSGWTANLLPEAVKVAIMQTAAHWYAVRETVNISATASAIPGTGKELLRPYRWRLIG